MLKREALEIVGSIGKPSKGKDVWYSYGLPASLCKTGTALRKVAGSGCEKCYAFDRGNYHRFAFKILPAQMKRLAAMDHPKWPAAMAKIILSGESKFFRMFDSGDLQSLPHLLQVVDLAKLLQPHGVTIWMPTQERRYIKRFTKLGGKIPKNLVIRLSSAMVDVPAATFNNMPTSSQSKNNPPIGFRCPSDKQGNVCGSCRACFNPDIKAISYPIH